MVPKKPRILMLASDCFPANSAEGIVNAKFVLAAQDVGWKIDVVSELIYGFGYPNYGGEFWAPVIRATRTFETPSGWNIPHLLAHLRAVCQTGHHLRSVTWAGPAISVGKRLLSENKYDFILSRSQPADVAALILSRKTDVPWIANWSDPFPMKKYPPPYGEGASTGVPWWTRRYFQAVAREADWHTFPCERLRQHVCSYLPNGVLAKSSIIPHICLERLHFRGDRTREVFSLCHVGRLTAPRDPDVFLEGVSRFLKGFSIRPPISIKFIGVQPENFWSTVQKCGLQKVISIEAPRPYIETLKEVANSDAAVLIEADCEEGIFLPAKFVDYVQTGKPVLAVSPAVGTIRDIISKHGGGIAVDCRSADAVARGLDILYHHWKRGTLRDHYGSSRLFQMFSENRVLKLYGELFAKMGS